jgi:AcrR family transcriptional regulator
MTPHTGDRPLTRRDRNRQAMVEEIKTTARQQLIDAGAAAVTLRGIARQMGIASSALYRYFASYDDLITALIVDAWDSLADAIGRARDDVPANDHVAAFSAICHGFRNWALANTGDFGLVFGTPVPGYQAPDEVTGAAGGRSLSLALTTYAAAVDASAADPDRAEIPPRVGSGELLPGLLSTVPGSAPRLAAITLTAYASLLGFLVFEIFGSLARLVEDTTALYEGHVRAVMLGMGFDRALLDRD